MRLGMMAATAVLAASGVHRPEHAEALYGRVVDPDSWTPYPDTARVLRGLADRGIPVAIVSNIAFDLRPAFARLGVDGAVTSFVLSYEVGAIKPDPDIFRAALGDLGPSYVKLGQFLATRPDVVCMDLRMSEGDGLTATRQIVSEREGGVPAVLVVTTFDMDADVFGALEAGADGAIPGERSLALSRAVSARRRMFSRSMASRALRPSFPPQNPSSHRLLSR